MKAVDDAVGSIKSGEQTYEALSLKVGDWISVRSPREILATLDEHACLDELPFMPQMLQYCGMIFSVRKRAHKMCDTVAGISGRQMADAVFLNDIHCDGEAFGGCEMACSIIWKEAWLRRVPDNERGVDFRPNRTESPYEADEQVKALVWNATRRAAPGQVAGEPVYSCQATKLPAATKPLSLWHLNQYVVDYRSGNVELSTILARFLFAVYAQLVKTGVGLGSALRWLYNAVQWVRGGVPFPALPGHLPAGGPTPAGNNLGLQVGDLVRVKSLDQILDTVDKHLLNRGLHFHPELVPYCGKTFRVKQRLQRLINEKNGKLVTLKNSCLVLDGVTCQGRYTQPVNCPRALPPYWREIWLERVEEGGKAPGSPRGERPVAD